MNNRQLTPADEARASIETNRDGFEVLVLGQMLTNNQMFAKARTVLCQDDRGGWRDDFLLPVSNIVYKVILTYNTVYNPFDWWRAPLPREAAQFLLEAALKQGELLDYEVPMALERLEKARAGAAEAANFVELGFPIWLKSARTRADIARTEHNPARWDPEQIAASVLKLSDKLGALWDGKPSLELFGDGLEGNIVRDRFHINAWPGLMKRLGGGVARRETYLAVGATGAGKTVFACQWAAELASQGYKGLLITTEQTPAELQWRIISNKCEVDFASLKDGLQLDRFNARQLENYGVLRNIMRKNLRFKDWTTSGDHVAGGLDGVIEEAKEAMGGLDFYVLDWVGGALDVSGSREHVRHLYQESADYSSRASKRHDVTGLVLAQAHPVTGVNNPQVRPRDVSECKTMHRNMDGFIGISAMRIPDDQAMGGLDIYSEDQIWYIDKARVGFSGPVRFKRRFRYQRCVEGLHA